MTTVNQGYLYVRPVRIASAILLSLAISWSLRLSPAAAHVQVQPSVTYTVDAQNGSDTNSCATPAQAWQTIPAAEQCLQPGDTLIFNAGIYTLDQSQTYFFGPSGVDVNHKTTYQAAPGARVIITGNNQKPVNIHLMAYMHIDGLWFGGSWDTVTNIDAFGHGEGANPLFVLGGPLNDVVNCTFFGYGQTGNAADYLFFQGNRSVRTGSGDLSHGIYLSGHDATTNQEDNHAIVDHNLFIGQEVQNSRYGQAANTPKTFVMGLGIQAWHLHNNNIITRNFVTHHLSNTIEANNAADSVRTDLVANNFWWEDGLASNTSYPDGYWMQKHINYWNNLGGTGGGIASADIHVTAIGNTLNTNAFQIGISNHLLPYAPVVNPLDSFTLDRNTVVAGEGLTPASLDQTIAMLQDSFSIGVNGHTIQTLLQDQTVESNFATLLNFTTPTTSPLYQTGTPWFNPVSPLTAPDPAAKINIGPGISAPTTPGYFWAAARLLGLQDYNDSSQPTTVPYLTYPYPDVNNPNGTVLVDHGPTLPPIPPQVVGLLPGAPDDGDGTRFPLQPFVGDWSPNQDPSLVNSVDPMLALPGDNVVYSLTVNAGKKGNLANILVTDVLPDTLKITGVSTAQGRTQISGHTVTFTLDNLNNAQAVTILVNATIDPHLIPPKDLLSVASATLGSQLLYGTAILHISRGLLPSTGEHPTPLPNS